MNKPASIPVHPCGRYRHNTVVFILAKVCHPDDNNGDDDDNNADDNESFGITCNIVLVIDNDCLKILHFPLNFHFNFHFPLNFHFHLKVHLNFHCQEHGLKNLRTIHRLDRLTSGLLMFGRCSNMMI